MLLPLKRVTLCVQQGPLTYLGRKDGSIGVFTPITPYVRSYVHAAYAWGGLSHMILLLHNYSHFRLGSQVEAAYQLIILICIQDDLYARCHQMFDTTESTEIHREKGIR